MPEKLEKLKEQLKSINEKIYSKKDELNSLNEKKALLENKIINTAMTECNISINEFVDAIHLLKDEKESKEKSLEDKLEENKLEENNKTTEEK